MWTELTPNGKYKARERYVDPLTGKTKIITTTIDKDTKAARKAAEEILRDKIEKLISSPAAKEYTLEQLLDSYIAFQEESGIQPNTTRRNKSTVGSMIDLLGMDTIASKLSARYIVDRLIKADLKNSTRNNYLLRFGAMMRWAYKHDYVDDIGYLAKIDRFQESSVREKIIDKYLEAEEVKKLLGEMKVERWTLLTHFLVLSGLRIGEAIALDDADVTDVILVNKTMDIGTGECKERTKTDSSTREVYIQPELADVVDQIRAYVRKDSFKHGYRSGLFFPDDDGNYIQYPAYLKYLRENALSILGRRITPHTMRHTHVSLLAAEGLPLEAIARRVGHEDSQITKQIYYHVTEKQKYKDREQISKIRIL